MGDCLFNIGGGHSLKVNDLVESILERCHVVLGFRPSIRLPPGTNTLNTVPPLDYRIDKVLNTGFQLNGSIEDEIDATLKFCRTHFKPLS